MVVNDLTFGAMRSLLCVLATVTTLSAAQPPAAFVEAGEKRRKEIPLGGDFRPDPTAPVFVAVGHGARILLSRDDGKTWNGSFDGTYSKTE